MVACHCFTSLPILDGSLQLTEMVFGTGLLPQFPIGLNVIVGSFPSQEKGFGGGIHWLSQLGVVYGPLGSSIQFAHSHLYFLGLGSVGFVVSHPHHSHLQELLHVLPLGHSLVL